MANYSSTATVTLNVNATQGRQMLKALDEQTKRLNNQINNLKGSTSELDKKKMARLTAELKKCESAAKMLRSESAQASEVLKRLNTASPKELTKTLATLKGQLQNIRRGTAEWDKQCAAINRVKSAITQMNASMTVAQSRWSRALNTFNQWSGAIMAASAAFFGFVSAGRKAVSAYAQMDEQIANSVKYTRMSREQVEELNANFKKMDTRTGREKLNEMAQEAGRLGKNTLESVQGYVEAADIINVALVDLGEGATQTIAKLSNIFGVEQALGTKKAMLSVGSAVNVLSQNCTASKPYLVNFAQRMAGIGATAGLTIPQILAFGAVLDANGQKVEMSATAIQKVIMNLANKNRQFAQTLGLDAEVLNKTLKHSAKDGLMMFLQRLHDIGESSGYENAVMTLAPAFKDMGLDAARVSQVLATLSKHIDEIYWQFGEADKAFKEATSASNEFNIFNNTVQAGIDKARYAVFELCVQLGEKLSPIMKHFYSSAGYFIRILNVIVSFIVQNRTAITSLIFAIVAYNVAIKAAIIQKWLFVAAAKANAAIMATENAVFQLGAAVVALCTGNVRKARAAWLAFNATLSASPWGIALAALAALIPLIIKLCSHTDSYSDKADKAIKKSKELSDSYLEEMKNIQHLIGTLEGATKGSEMYTKAKDDLIKQYGQYLAGLIDEKGEIIDLSKAYETLSMAVFRANQMRGLHAAQEEIDKGYFKEQTSDLNHLREALENFGANPIEAASLVAKVSMAVMAGKGIDGKTFNRIREITSNGAVLNPRTGAPLHGFSKSIANSFIGSVSADDKPLNILNGIFSKRKDYDKAQQSLNYQELGINPSKNVHNHDLMAARDELKKIVEDNMSGATQIPYFFVPEGMHAEFNNGVYSAEGLKKIAADKATGKYVLASSKNPEMSRNGIGKDPLNFSWDSPQIVSKGAHDKFSGKEQAFVYLSPAEAKLILEKVEQEARARGFDWTKGSEPKADGPEAPDFVSQKELEKERKKQEAEARRAQIKAKKEFRDQLKAIRGERDAAQAAALVQRTAGDINYRQWFDKNNSAEDKFFKDSLALYEKWGLKDDPDYDQILKKKAEHEEKYNSQRVALNKEAVQRISKLEQDAENYRFQSIKKKSLADERRHSEKILQIKLDELENLQSMYEQGSKEWEEYQNKIDDLLFKEQSDQQTRYAKLMKEAKEAFKGADPALQFKIGKDTLSELLDNGMIDEDLFAKMLAKLKKDHAKNLPGSSDSAKQKKADKDEKFEEEKKKLDAALNAGMIDQYEYSRRLSQLKQQIYGGILDPLKEIKSEWVSTFAAMGDAWKNFADSLKNPELSVGEKLEALSDGIAATAAMVAAISSSVTDYINADLELQTQAVERRYNKELKYAEGNAFMTKQLEKKKEKEIAEMKAEASRKAFAMQVFGAVAQTASNAISAYGAALQIPGVGLVLAPIAAGLAVAQGMVQVATMKKQQEAAASTGYSEGGFTAPGPKDQPAGIVHAGEWVASQKLVNSPSVRPIINMLELAQRQNRMPRFPMEAAYTVLRVNTIRESKEGRQEVVVSVPKDPELSGAVSKLVKKLDQPLVSINTVSGDAGSYKAQKLYKKLLANKSGLRS
ncbi:MAG: phage tail tape measure protein [Muribaculaceae bacterium]|nr:phage tail tape measure protein [Muribaculaceae bacterium]